MPTSILLIPLQKQLLRLKSRGRLGSTFVWNLGGGRFHVLRGRNVSPRELLFFAVKLLFKNWDALPMIDLPRSPKIRRIPRTGRGHSWIFKRRKRKEKRNGFNFFGTHLDSTCNWKQPFLCLENLPCKAAEYDCWDACSSTLLWLEKSRKRFSSSLIQNIFRCVLWCLCTKSSTLHDTGERFLKIESKTMQEGAFKKPGG